MFRYILIFLYKLRIKMDRYTAKHAERRWRELTAEMYELRKDEKILMQGGPTIFNTGLTALRDEIFRLECKADGFDRQQAQCAVRIYRNRRKLRSMGVEDIGPPVNPIPKVTL